MKFEFDEKALQNLLAPTMAKVNEQIDSQVSAGQSVEEIASVIREALVSNGMEPNEQGIREQAAEIHETLNADGE